MFQSLGAIIGEAPAARSSTPVRRESQLAGRCEAMFWHRTDRPTTAKIILAAERYELAGKRKRKGSRNGPLGHVGIEVLRYLTNLIDHRTGRLDPSLETIMRRTGRSKDAVVRALKALRAHGFLDWLRRYVPTKNEGRGPKVQQTSNAYRLSIPARAMRLLGRLGQPAPAPDDHTHAVQARKDALDAHEATLAHGDRARFVTGDPDLAEALGRLGDLMQERESARRSESKTKDLR